MALFVGMRLGEKLPVPVVTKDKSPFRPERSLQVRRHSPNGFNWGYEGSGPAQLALALLLDVVGPRLAQRYYQQFKRERVALWGNNWCITDTQIKEWVHEALKENRLLDPDDEEVKNLDVEPGQ